MEKVKVDIEVQAEFRRVLCLPEDAVLPEKLLDAYAALKYMNDICGAGQVGAKELILLCVMTGNLPARFGGLAVFEPQPPRTVEVVAEAKAAAEAETVAEPVAEPEAGPAADEQAPPEPPQNYDFNEGDLVVTTFKGKPRNGVFVGFNKHDGAVCHVKIEGDKLNFQKVQVADTKPRG
jgi:hypothetical protein